MDDQHVAHPSEHDQELFHVHPGVRITAQRSRQYDPVPYKEYLITRREREQRMRVPRSMHSWESEEELPGSWNTGVGRWYSPAGSRIDVGHGQFFFDFVPDDENGGNRR